ncbi:MAG: hypothetical protein DMG91_09665 [Acidobacteria bacterium]|jgi:hypothetical protein|nr:MAG: hypothetical protein DMG91_09665 [Acidobacteriota bacterium]
MFAAKKKGPPSMIRWIAFDDETADAIITRFRRGAAEIHHGNPLDEALAAGRPSILLLPSSTPGRVFMARIQPRAVPDTTEFSSANSGLAEPVYEPSGFLGLSDEPVFARRPPQPAPPEHKKWWQRLRAS